MNEYVPSEFYLGQNYPNPFKEKTTIKYCVPCKTRVRLTVYNAEGNMVEKLIDEVEEAGTYEIEFYTGRLPYGIYYYRMTAGIFSETKQMEKLK
jgi:hypothetical protein